MIRRAAAGLLFLAAACSAGPGPESRPAAAPTGGGEGPGLVIVASLDGLGQRIWRTDPAAARLTSLRRVADAGVVARGMVQAFPTGTPGAHAALWTGAYPDVSGISAAANPLRPRSEHTVVERGSGFDSRHLLAEPIWVTAAREGVRVVASQATQSHPFIPFVTAPDAPVAPVLISGYGPPMRAPHRLLSASDLRRVDAAPWMWFQERSALPIRVFAVELAGRTVHAVLVAEGVGRNGYDAVYLAEQPDGPAVRAEPAPLETGPPVDRPLARHFTDGLPLELDGGVPSVAFFRLFALEPDGSDFLLYHPSVHQIALYDGEGGARDRSSVGGVRDPGVGLEGGGPVGAGGSGDPAESIREFIAAGGGFIGNGPSWLWRDGELGRPLHAGGDGTAERRYLEGMELVVRQYDRMSRWLVDRYSPELLIDYSNYPDEVDHWWYALAGGAGTRDDAVRDGYQAFREWAYMALDRRVAILDSLAGPAGTIIFVSDHGMAVVTHEVAVNVVLRDAGLLMVERDGSVDAARSRAAYHSHSVLVNTEDWKDGIVPLHDRAAVVDRVEAALRDVRNPETGEPVFTAFFRPELDGERLGIGGPSGGDIYFDVADGYRPIPSTRGAAIRRVPVPYGYHGFLPTRPDMLAVFIARGPAFPQGRRIPTIRAIDVAPTLAEILGIDPPADSRGVSVLGGTGVRRERLRGRPMRRPASGMVLAPPPMSRRRRCGLRGTGGRSGAPVLAPQWRAPPLRWTCGRGQAPHVYPPRRCALIGWSAPMGSSAARSWVRACCTAASNWSPGLGRPGPCAWVSRPSSMVRLSGRRTALGRTKTSMPVAA